MLSVLRFLRSSNDTDEYFYSNSDTVVSLSSKRSWWKRRARRSLVASRFFLYIFLRCSADTFATGALIRTSPSIPTL